jgi:Rap1a immunity proteins
MLKEIRGQFLPCLGVLAVVMIATTQAKSHEFTGNEFFSKCQAVTNAYNGKQGSVPIQNSIAANECIEVLSAVFQMSRMIINTKTMEPMFHFCPPEGVNFTGVQLALIFENYAREHPERLSYPSTWLVNEAMVKAFHAITIRNRIAT